MTRGPIGETLSPAQLERLSLLAASETLERGSAYLDLQRVGDGPFTQRRRRVGEEGERIVSKPEADPLLWDRVVAVGLGR